MRRDKLVRFAHNYSIFETNSKTKKYKNYQ
jgi:hypothetical protein